MWVCVWGSGWGVFALAVRDRRHDLSTPTSFPHPHLGQQYRKTNSLAVRAALDALTLERDGVDGRSIYIYGEAWDFGEVALGARGRNASQLNVGGTRIGAFNDRMRDGAMGGSPFEAPDAQGFVTGLSTDPNGAPHQGDAARQLEALLERTDWVRAALAGGLASKELRLKDGRVVAGRRALYHGTQVSFVGFVCFWFIGSVRGAACVSVFCSLHPYHPRQQHHHSSTNRPTNQPTHQPTTQSKQTKQN